MHAAVASAIQFWGRAIMAKLRPRAVVFSIGVAVVGIIAMKVESVDAQTCKAAKIV